MNNQIIDEIKTELDRVSQFHNNKLFTVEYLDDEYQNISSAREKEYPTYRSEYRVAKTLIRARNEIIYNLQKSSHESLKEFITVSKLLKQKLKSIGDICSEEKLINDAAYEYDKTYL